MPKQKSKVPVKESLRRFEEENESGRSRKGAFRIDAPFDEAMKKILKAKPEPKKKK